MNHKKMIGVIIAAGIGGRLSKVTGGMPKTLLPIQGKPILQWIIDGARNAGIQEFVIISGYQQERIVDYFNITPQEGISIVFNHEWRGGNGISVLKAHESVQNRGEFLLMMSDHLLDYTLFKEIMESSATRPFLVVERDLEKVFDIEDATKVTVDNGKITYIGKDITDFNGVDAGVFVLNESIFDFLKISIEKGDDSLTGGVREMIKNSNLFVYTIPQEEFWIDIDSEGAFQKANEMWRTK